MKLTFKFLLTVLSVFLLFGTSSGNHDFPVLKGPYLGQTPPGKIPEIFAPGIISYGFHEFGISFSPDGKEILYLTADNNYRQKTLIYLRRKDNTWSSPEIAPFSGQYSDYIACFSPNGNKIFFSSKRPLSKNSDKQKDLDIWVIEKNGDSWKNPVHLGSTVNSERSDMVSCVSNKGTLFIRSDREGKGKWFIFSSRLENGLYTKPEKLNDRINLGPMEGSAFLAPDESYLLFRSSRPGGFGKYDIYVCFKQESGSWGDPINAGEPINSPANDFAPRITPDGKYIFFTSYRPLEPDILKVRTYRELIKLYRMSQNGYGTLYWIDARIINKLR